LIATIALSRAARLIPQHVKAQPREFRCRAGFLGLGPRSFQKAGDLKKF
jgi:hypothetical protein